MKIIFSLLLLSTLVVAAKPIEPTLLDQKIISQTFNEEYDLAKKTCDEQIKLNPLSPKYYYYLINVKILEYYQKVAEFDQDKRDEGRKILNKGIIDYCETVLDKFDESKLDLENKFYLGTIYAYAARIYGMDGSWWSAFKSGKTAKSLMEDILKSDSQFYDSYLVLGMIEYYADRMSGITSFIAGILGLSGDREKGLYHLQLAYDKGKLTFGQSALTLIEVYSSLEGNEYAALPYFESFLNRFPRNHRTLNAYCQMLMNIWDYKKAESLIKNDKQNLIDDYARARFYDAKGDSKLAIQYGELALDNEKKLSRGGGGAVRYIIVFNSWLMGDYTKVKKYESALNDRNKADFENTKKNAVAAKWLREFAIQIASEKSINDVENFIKSKPAFGAGNGFEDQFNILTGQFYFKNNLLNKAESFFNKLLTSTDERDRNTTMKYLIDIYMRQDVDKKKVKNLISAIDDSKNSRLGYRSRDLEKKYNL
ncbi:MAG: hypothetical protein NTX65_09350 [Ignavibacteriales bacterium]|nr:hypothetical protein [Ignavibacteriales bacterium]